MNWSTEVTNLFFAARAAFGVSYTVAGNPATFQGVQIETADLLPLTGGGFVQDYDGGLEILNSDVTVPNGTLVTIGGQTFRVIYQKGSQEDPVTLLYLQGINK